MEKIIIYNGVDLVEIPPMRDEPIAGVNDFIIETPIPTIKDVEKISDSGESV